MFAVDCVVPRTVGPDFTCALATTRGYWHVIVSSQNVYKNEMCVKSHTSRLLSAMAIFMTWQTPLLKCPKSKCRYQSNTVLVRTTVCAGLGKRLHKLPSHQTLSDLHSFSSCNLTTTGFSPTTTYCGWLGVQQYESINWMHEEGPLTFELDKHWNYNKSSTGDTTEMWASVPIYGFTPATYHFVRSFYIS